MREARERTPFKRDMKREIRGRHRMLLRPSGELWEVVGLLARDIPLPYPCHDHPLRGDWEGSRECHIRPDFLLIYTLEGDDVLVLERLGSHSELFGL